MKKIVLILIRAYQTTGPVRRSFWSSIIPVYGSCRYSPTCSEYTYQAVQKYGIVKGLFLGLKRVVSCNPLGGHGYKPLV